MKKTTLLIWPLLFSSLLSSISYGDDNPVPTITSISPASAIATSADFTLTVNGNNFVSGSGGNSVVRFGSVAVGTTFVSRTQLTALLPASLILQAAAVPVTVFNPAPGGGTSNSLSFTIVVSACSQPCVAPAPGLVNWWPLDETSGTTAVDIIGANSGTLVNGPTPAPGMVASALSFDGAISFVKLPDNFFPYPVTGTSNAPFSFDAWFKTGSGGVILGQQVVDPFGVPIGWVPAIYVDTAGRLRVEMFWKGSIDPITSPATVNDAAFHHVAVTYDGTTQSVYLDGVLIGAKPHTQVAVGSILKYQLGTGYTSGWPGGTSGWYSFNGVIDEVDIYNRALSAAEIQAIVSAGSAGKCKNAPFINAPAALPGGVTGVAYSQTLSAVLGAAPYSFSIASGTLPPGLSLATTGAITGSPTTTGTFTFTIQVTDSARASSRRTYSMAVVTCTPPPAGLVSWWPGDGNANDIAGGNPGTLQSGATFAAGKVGQAFNLNTGYVQVANSTNLNPTTGLTVEAWVNPSSLSVPFGKAVSKEVFSFCSDPYQVYSLGFDAGGNKPAFGTAHSTSPGDASFVISSDPITTGQWYHLVGTFDGSKIRIYVNGVLKGEAPANKTTIATSAQPLTVGRSLTCGNGLPGLYDEVSIYSRALTSTEIAAIFSSGSAGKCR